MFLVLKIHDCKIHYLNKDFKFLRGRRPLLLIMYFAPEHELNLSNALVYEPLTVMLIICKNQENVLFRILILLHLHYLYIWSSQLTNCVTFCRAYYRCTHRHTQGCLATKQVQQSDEDQSIFHITCKGRHTCNQATQSTNILGKESKKQKKEDCTQEARPENETTEMLSNCETTSLKTAKLEAMLENFPSFSFPSTSTENTSLENNIFSNSLWENASESDYFSLSPCHMNEFETCQYLQDSESDNIEMLSARTSVSNSPTEDLDISLDQVKFDPDFPFDLAEYFH